MKGYLVVAARDGLGGVAGEQLLTDLRTCVTDSSTGVLVLVDSLAGLGGDGQPDSAAVPGLLVVGSPPPYDGRPLRALLLTAPVDPDGRRFLVAWLRDGATDLFDLPLAVSGLLLRVTVVAPHTVDRRGAGISSSSRVRERGDA